MPAYYEGLQKKADPSYLSIKCTQCECLLLRISIQPVSHCRIHFPIEDRALFELLDREYQHQNDFLFPRILFLTVTRSISSWKPEQPQLQHQWKL
jgi:hypothetical protein